MYLMYLIKNSFTFVFSSKNIRTGISFINHHSFRLNPSPSPSQTMKIGLGLTASWARARNHLESGSGSPGVGLGITWSQARKHGLSIQQNELARSLNRTRSS